MKKKCRGCGKLVEPLDFHRHFIGGGCLDGKEAPYMKKIDVRSVTETGVIVVINALIDSYEALERRVGEVEGKVEWIKNEFLMNHDTEPLKPSQGKELCEKIFDALIYRRGETIDGKLAQELSDQIIELVEGNDTREQLKNKY